MKLLLEALTNKLPSKIPTSLDRWRIVSCISGCWLLTYGYGLMIYGPINRPHLSDMLVGITFAIYHSVFGLISAPGNNCVNLVQLLALLCEDANTDTVADAKCMQIALRNSIIDPGLWPYALLTNLRNYKKSEQPAFWATKHICKRGGAPDMFLPSAAAQKQASLAKRTTQKNSVWPFFVPLAFLLLPGFFVAPFWVLCCPCPCAHRKERQQ